MRSFDLLADESDRFNKEYFLVEMNIDKLLSILTSKYENFLWNCLSTGIFCPNIIVFHQNTLLKDIIQTKLIVVN